MANIYRASLLLLSFGIAGCTVGPDYEMPTIALTSAYIENNGKGAPIQPDRFWWRDFRDPLLDEIVSKALAENLDIGQAVERIVEATASMDASDADAKPDLSGSASVTGEGSDSESGGVSTSAQTLSRSGQLNISWLLDVFGKYKRNREAAVADLGAAYADADTARLTLLSEIATEYVYLRLYQAQATITRQTISSRSKTLSLVREQRSIGLTSELGVAQSEALLRTAEASLPGYEIEFRKSANRIAYLAGEQPGAFLRRLQKGASIPFPRFDVSAGIPADLLRNRPDIRKAERDLASATASIGVAVADLYPSLSLSGALGLTLTATSGGAATQLSSWSFGPVADIPIFDGGARRAKVRIAESQARQQYLAWKDSVLNAAREVENALTAWRRQTAQVRSLKAAVDAYQKTVSLADESYKSGTSSFLDVLDAERSLFEARLSLASAEAQQAINFVTLNVAAGGGYASGATTRGK